MASGEYYQVQIGNIVLSSDGANTGIKCRLEVENAKNLIRSFAGVSIVAGDGSSVDQVVPWTAGKEFAVKITQINKAQWLDLKTLFDTSATTGSNFTVTGTGAPGNFTVNAKAFVSDPYEWERFDANYLHDLILRMKTV